MLYSPSVHSENPSFALKFILKATVFLDLYQMQLLSSRNFVSNVLEPEMHSQTIQYSSIQYWNTSACIVTATNNKTYRESAQKTFYMH